MQDLVKLTLLILISNPAFCSGADIFLVGGSGPHEGNIIIDGMPVCDDTFTSDSKYARPNTEVVCRMLGLEARNFTMGSKFGRVSDDFGIDSLKCKGDEMDIRDCPHETEALEDCGGNEGAGVICYKKGLELRGGSGSHEGNIFLDGRPVCDDGFSGEESGHENAIVVCRMLGFESGTFRRNSHFGKVPNNFIMDNVHCLGTEKDIRDCPHDSIDNCERDEGAGVICSGAKTILGERSGLSTELIGFIEDTNRGTSQSSSVVPPGPVCVCNGFKHIFNGRTTGECLESVASCGKWCYVDLDSDCPDVRPSNNGAPYAWSCRACNNSVIRSGTFPTNQPDRAEGDNSGAFVNTVAICLFLILVVTGIVLFWWCRKRQMRRRVSRGRELAALELKESGQEYWPSSRKNTGRSTARRSTTTSLAEYWPAATTRENFEEAEVEEELRESVDSNNYWVPSDDQSNYDKMG